MTGETALELFLGTLASEVKASVEAMTRDRIVERIWRKDHTVWKPEPEEITNRLGWLHVAEAMIPRLPEVDSFVEEVRSAGLTQAVLLGMGGSSLAPEVLARIFPRRPGFLDLTVLDTTHPDAIARVRDRLDLKRSLFIVATKSGGTVETISLFKYFYNLMLDVRPPHQVGGHFCAITDPGSGLEERARSLAFRKIFLNDPEIGGRYSALSYFGLVPAALMGTDIRTILERGRRAAQACGVASPGGAEPNPGLLLGSVLGTAARAGRDKMTLMVDPLLANLADWVEQLVAESTGKEGRGILPVAGEPLGPPDVYGDDRVFVWVGAGKGGSWQGLEALREAGFPCVGITVGDPHDVGALFFVWEFATAVAAHLLGVNPFDQPNVESAKIQAKKMLGAYRESGTLPRLPATAEQEGLQVLGHSPAATPADALRRFVDHVSQGGYVAIQAYVPPDQETDRSLGRLQKTLRNRTRKAVTVGYGPRFLHSTGQLHKGDAGKGSFIQISSDISRDVPIPDAPGEPASSVTFGALIAAQAHGDREALLQAGRPVLRLHVTRKVAEALDRLCEHLD
ncbi:transaldolase / glucose-6-phosphate isomerase [Desulfacinum hydrothermale DSM 13146]|uniref:Glucose-6-phosphate isomerase n=1 Tax=Desulfacinum hydrothermale DSM 13146 TaxID=1121390 RepID=A0A1W1WWX7_9BACT|nr:hypothetical protein [Desulfacinum hydrothermale]SMC16155.1 transaldolase / glucose-6-phosphate isomerase [Desulfacinum hydrothermale DSM 13146]